jgi:hypothetical protein
MLSLLSVMYSLIEIRYHFISKMIEHKSCEYRYVDTIYHQVNTVFGLLSGWFEHYKLGIVRDSKSVT